MINSLIVGPQRSFGRDWFLDARIPNLAIPWALVGLTCAGLWAIRCRDESALALLKSAFAVVVALLSLAGLYDAMMSFVPPFVWLVAVQPEKTGQHRIGSLPRAILALIAAIQILYAYPVAGAQVPFIAVIMVAVAAICLSDSFPSLYVWFPRLRLRATSTMGLPWPAMTLTMLYVASGAWAIQGYQRGEPLDLPGTERMRIDHNSAELVRSLTRRVDSSPCSMLASAPGLLSFNFLTGRSAPPSIDFSAWMLVLSDADQRKAMAEISREQHPCVLYDQSLIDFWTHGADVSSRPLIRFMKENFEVVYETGGYQFMEPKPKSRVSYGQAPVEKRCGIGGGSGRRR